MSLRNPLEACAWTTYRPLVKSTQVPKGGAHRPRTHLHRKRLISGLDVISETNFFPISVSLGSAWWKVLLMAGPMDGNSLGLISLYAQMSQGPPQYTLLTATTHPPTTSVLGLRSPSCARLLLHPWGWGKCIKITPGFQLSGKLLSILSGLEVPFHQALPPYTPWRTDTPQPSSPTPSPSQQRTYQRGNPSGHRDQMKGSGWCRSWLPKGGETCHRISWSYWNTHRAPLESPCVSSGI